MVEDAGNSTELRVILGGNANLKPPLNQTTTQPETTTPRETRPRETTRGTSHAGSRSSHAACRNAAPPKVKRSISSEPDVYHGYLTAVLTPASALFELKLCSSAEESKTSTSSPRARPPPPHPDLHLLTQSQTSTSCQKSSRTAERRGWRPEACGARVDRILRLETRGLQHRTRGPGLWLRRADGGAKTLEDDITPPTRILFI
ncbi:unnamed protein product [Boreogadus saida]